MALKIPQPLHSFIPRKRDTFEFTIPEFHPMASAEPPPPPPPPASNVVAPSAEFFAERWDAGRRENLVMVFNADGRIFAVSRAALMKSRNDRESDYEHALRYIHALFDPKKSLEEAISQKPNLRLQALYRVHASPAKIFDETHQYVEIDPRSWSDVWAFADRIRIVDQ